MDSIITSRPEWRVQLGDAASELRKLADVCIDCVVSSPPYFWQRDYDVSGQIGHEPTIAAYVEAIVSVFREVRRVLCPTGTVFLNLGDTYYSAKGRPHGKD